MNSIIHSKLHEALVAEIKSVDMHRLMLEEVIAALPKGLAHEVLSIEERLKRGMLMVLNEALNDLANVERRRNRGEFT